MEKHLSVIQNTKIVSCHIAHPGISECDRCHRYYHPPTFAVNDLPASKEEFEKELGLILQLEQQIVTSLYPELRSYCVEETLCDHEKPCGYHHYKSGAKHFSINDREVEEDVFLNKMKEVQERMDRDHIINSQPYKEVK